MLAFAQNTIQSKSLVQTTILTEDIDNFWSAYDSLGTCNDYQDSINCIRRYYFEKGTAGFQAFINKYQFTVQDYLLSIKQYPKFYNSVRHNTLIAKSMNSEFNHLFEKVLDFYPEYKPLTIVFLIGPLQQGGTTTGNFLLIATEILASTKIIDLSEFGNSALGHVLSFDINVHDHILFMVAHETVHDLQINADFNNYNLLNKSIIEGSADFIAELFTGVTANHYLYDYGKLHEQELIIKFKKAIENNANTDNWMYNYDRVEEGVPADLGYYIGYRISESYYNHCRNKTEAVHEIIELENPKDFFEKSQYGKNY